MKKKVLILLVLCWVAVICIVPGDQGPAFLANVPLWIRAGGFLTAVIILGYLFVE